MDAEIKREFDRLHRRINELVAVQKKETWVSATWVTDATGWSKYKLRQAREQKIVEFKDNQNGGYLYLLESIPEQFIIKKQAS